MLAPLILTALLCNPHEGDGVGFVELKPLGKEWTFFTPYSGKRLYEFSAIDPGFDWNELIVSWNVAPGPGLGFEAKAKVLGETMDSGYYHLGNWSLDTAGRRESVKDQSDDLGMVDTDTLVLKKATRRVTLQLSISFSQTELAEPLKFVGLSFRNSTVSPSPEDPNRSAWGKTIEVPQRSQMSYEGGIVWCSPTCVSMMLAHWAKVLKQPELDKDVPEVAASVNDPNWPGTGNWPFNTAYAGSFPGIRAYVARFGGVREIEDWIAAGIPVTASVSLALLKGKPKKEPNDGHLVVVVGFTQVGDPIFNDPGRSKEIRQIYKREHFEAAWKNSGNTVYLIYPESMKPPKNRLKHWAD